MKTKLQTMTGTAFGFAAVMAIGCSAAPGTDPASVSEHESSTPESTGGGSCTTCLYVPPPYYTSYCPATDTSCSASSYAFYTYAGVDQLETWLNQNGCRYAKWWQPNADELIYEPVNGWQWYASGTSWKAAICPNTSALQTELAASHGRHASSTSICDKCLAAANTNYGYTWVIWDPAQLANGGGGTCTSGCMSN